MTTVKRVAVSNADLYSERRFVPDSSFLTVGTRNVLLRLLAVAAYAGGLVFSTVTMAQERAARTNFTILGTVLSVEDGDTLTLRGTGGGRFHIRLSDLDAPEIEHSNNPYRDRRTCRNAPRRAPGQTHAEAAREALNRRAPRKAAARAECYTIDRYGRPICHVFIGATNLNLEQLRDGWAMLLSKRSWVRDPASDAAAASARSARRGMWAGVQPQSPEQWRARCWCQGECAAPLAQGARGDG